MDRYASFPGVRIETGGAWDEHMFGVIEVRPSIVPSAAPYRVPAAACLRANCL